jgi:hypothetical protein
MSQSDLLTRPDIDLESLFAQSIPCMDCDQPARFRSFGHIVNDCGPSEPGGPPPPYYKCASCFTAWYTDAQQIIREDGSICCAGCQRDFTTPDSFSNYREF